MLVQRPYHLTSEESEQWLRRQAEMLAAVAGVRGVDMTPLSSASLRFGREWDWLLEIHLQPDVNPHDTVRSNACAGLLADLRLLGMRPAVAIADRTASVGDAC